MGSGRVWHLCEFARVSCFFLVHSHLRSSIIFHSSILSCTISKLPAYVRILKTEKYFDVMHGCLSLHFFGFRSIIFALLELFWFPRKICLSLSKIVFHCRRQLRNWIGLFSRIASEQQSWGQKNRPFPVWMRPLPPNWPLSPSFPPRISSTQNKSKMKRKDKIK